MTKTVLITGSTDGIGLATAKMMASKGHTVLLHGRSSAKLEAAETTLSSLPGAGRIETYVADLSRMRNVEDLAKAVSAIHAKLDVLINNAGVFKSPEPVTADGLDVRFAVNTIAPYLLTQRLLPRIVAGGRVVNLSSAAQARVDPKALAGQVRLSEMEAYSQSKLALTMWSRAVALSLDADGPIVFAVNPGSMLGSKMVTEGFGVAGGDIGIGADILTRAALDEDFGKASGKYFDNDLGRFGPPHPDALDPEKSAEIMQMIETVLARTAI